MTETSIPVDEFERWLRLGLGRAILYLKRHDAAPYREAIVAACRSDWRYDPQCEETRAEYLWELLNFDLIRQAVERTTDAELLHRAGIAVRDVLAQHHSSDAVAVLRHLYEHGPCSMCREDFVELLIEYDALPSRLAAECRWDANPDTRQLVAERYGD